MGYLVKKGVLNSVKLKSGKTTNVVETESNGLDYIGLEVVEEHDDSLAVSNFFLNHSLLSFFQEKKRKKKKKKKKQ